MFNSKIEIYFSKAQDWRWRLKARNGEIIAIGEGYTTKQNAIISANRLKEIALEADIVDIS